MTVTERAHRLPQLDPERRAAILHRPDSEPKRTLCLHCLLPVLHAAVNGETVIADLYEWEPRAQCRLCLHTRRAHPASFVNCGRCGDSGYVGEKRPPGRMLAIDVGWGDDIHLRLVGPRTDRRRGEALHPLHVCHDRLDHD